MEEGGGSAARRPAPGGGAGRGGGECRRRRPPLGGGLAWASAVAAVLAVSCSPQVCRGLEPRSDHGTACRNTVQGRHMMTDEKGYVCNIQDMDFVSGCCPQEKAVGHHTCESCEDATKCCDSYEMCVSCCMAPDNDQIRSQAMKADKDKLTFKAAVEKQDVFEFCRASCRHSSKSTVHGNAYVSSNRFCISPVATVGSGAPKDLQLVAGNQGESCDVVCSKKNLRCDLRFLQRANTCEELMKVFPCNQEHCLENFGHDQPAYVSNEANTEMFGKCLFNGKEQYFSCAGSHSDTRRLCPCRKPQAHSIK